MLVLTIQFAIREDSGHLTCRPLMGVFGTDVLIEIAWIVSLSESGCRVMCFLILNVGTVQNKTFCTIGNAMLSDCTGIVRIWF